MVTYKTFHPVRLFGIAVLASLTLQFGCATGPTPEETAEARRRQVETDHRAFDAAQRIKAYDERSSAGAHLAEAKDFIATADAKNQRKEEKAKRQMALPTEKNLYEEAMTGDSYAAWYAARRFEKEYPNSSHKQEIAQVLSRFHTVVLTSPRLLQWKSAGMSELTTIKAVRAAHKDFFVTIAGFTEDGTTMLVGTNINFIGTGERDPMRPELTIPSVKFTISAGGFPDGLAVIHLSKERGERLYLTAMGVTVVPVGSEITLSDTNYVDVLRVPMRRGKAIVVQNGVELQSGVEMIVTGDK